MSLMDDWPNGTLKEGTPCDYDNFIELTEKVNRYGEDAARFEMALYDANREIKHLRALLKKCDDCVRALKAFGVSECNGHKLTDLLTRINAAIGESEE